MQHMLRALGMAAGVETKELSQSVCMLSLLQVGCEQGARLLLLRDLLRRQTEPTCCRGDHMEAQLVM